MGLKRRELRLASGVGRLGAASGLGGGSAVARLNPLIWLDPTGVLWQDSAATTAATADADPVGNEPDRSGNGRAVIQATAGLRPALGLAAQNGRNVLRLAGTTYLLVSGFAPNPPFTLVMAIKGQAGGSAMEILGWGNNSGAGARFGVYSQADRTIGAENSGSIRAGSALAAGTWHLLTQQLADSTFTNLVQWIDGVSDPMAGGSGSVAIPGSSVELRVGGIPTVDAEAVTDVGDVVLVSGTPTAAALGPAWAELRAKWGTP